MANFCVCQHLHGTIFSHQLLTSQKMRSQKVAERWKYVRVCLCLSVLMLMLMHDAWCLYSCCARVMGLMSPGDGPAQSQVERREQGRSGLVPVRPCLVSNIGRSPGWCCNSSSQAAAVARGSGHPTRVSSILPVGNCYVSCICEVCWMFKHRWCSVLSGHWTVGRVKDSLLWTLNNVTTGCNVSRKGDKSDKDSDYTSADWHKSELLECLYFVVGNEIFRRHLTQRF